MLETIGWICIALVFAFPVLGPLIWPRLMPESALNREGQRGFVDVGCFKVGLGLGLVLCVTSAIKQGETHILIFAMAIGVGLALALLMGIWGHVIWRRQSSRRRSDWIPSR